MDKKVLMNKVAALDDKLENLKSMSRAMLGVNIGIRHGEWDPREFDSAIDWITCEIEQSVDCCSILTQEIQGLFEEV